LYPKFIQFVKESVQEITAKGHSVEVAGIFYHVGENDMSFHPYRRDAAQRVQAIINQSRKDLAMPKLKWFVSQQPPTNVERLNKLDVVADFAKVAAADANFIHLKTFNLPPQEKMLVITTEGIVRLGEAIAKGYLEKQ
jgi:hypothetical protein